VFTRPAGVFLVDQYTSKNSRTGGMKRADLPFS
jgi:hypothetical protein